MKKIILLFLYTYIVFTFLGCKIEKSNNSKIDTRSENKHNLSKAQQLVITTQTSSDSIDNINFQNTGKPIVDFFKGKDADIANKDIDTTRISADDDGLPNEITDKIPNKLKTIILNGKHIPFSEYFDSHAGGIASLPSYNGFDLFILLYEYGDTEYWEMCIAHHGVVDAQKQRLCVHYVWDDWGAENESKADYQRISYRWLANQVLCLHGEKRDKGLIDFRNRYYRINAKGYFEEIK